MEHLGELFTPWNIGCMVLMTVSIVGLAKAWKKIKDKKAEAASGTPPTAPS